MTPIRLPSPSVVVLVGPSASGKSTWAAAHAEADQVLSSDRLRALVGEGEHDLRASADAFTLLDLALDRRCARGLTTVVDSLGLDADRRSTYLATARRHGLACVAVVFDVTPTEARARNRQRDVRVPDKVLAGQLRSWPDARRALDLEGFDAVHAAGPAVFLPPALLHEPVGVRPALQFGLQIPQWHWPGGAAEMGERLTAIAGAAEEAGFASLWVMDHLRQIPSMGPAWDDMPESYTALAFVAATTRRLRLGTLVTGITYRNVAHLGKIVATLDVLSGGRVWCGLGAAWFRDEHLAYGWPFPSASERLDLLEDALQLLPLLWGPGAPRFEGKVLTVPEASCYPRPLQERLPLLVGGGGERRTLRLAATYADACNVIGEADVVRRKVSVLRRHCADIGRDVDAVEVTQLGTVLVADDRAGVADAVERLRPKRVAAERVARQVNAGTVEDHVRRLHGLAEAGVETAIVSLADLEGIEPVERFAEVIEAFR